MSIEIIKKCSSNKFIDGEQVVIKKFIIKCEKSNVKNIQSKLNKSIKDIITTKEIIERVNYKTNGNLLIVKIHLQKRINECNNKIEFPVNKEFLSIITRLQKTTNNCPLCNQIITQESCIHESNLDVVKFEHILTHKPIKYFLKEQIKKEFHNNNNYVCYCSKATDTSWMFLLNNWKSNINHVYLECQSNKKLQQAVFINTSLEQIKYEYNDRYCKLLNHKKLKISKRDRWIEHPIINLNLLFNTQNSKTPKEDFKSTKSKGKDNHKKYKHYSDELLESHNDDLDLLLDYN